MPAAPRWTATALLLSVGCAGPAFDGRTYRGEGYAFRVPPAPSGWHRLEVEQGGLAFRDPPNDGLVAVTGRCGDNADDVPLASLTQHLFIQFTDRDVLTQEVVPFDGREAMHTVLLAKLDGVPKKFDVWVMKKDGCIFDLYYIARPDRFDAGAPAFVAFVKGFSAESTGDH
jgi:hypothetical protein